MDCSNENICWYPKYWTKNMNNVKPSPVKPPIIHPFAFPFTPAIIPPINNEMKPITKVTQDNVGSLNVDRKSTRLNSSHVAISYAVFCLKKKLALTNKIV